MAIPEETRLQKQVSVRIDRENLAGCQYQLAKLREQLAEANAKLEEARARIEVLSASFSEKEWPTGMLMRRFEADSMLAERLAKPLEAQKGDGDATK